MKFPLGPMVNQVALWQPSWICNRQTNNKLGRGQPSHHFYNVTIPWAEQFLTRRSSNLNQLEDIIGPGSHVGFPICTKIIDQVQNHPRNIHIMQKIKFVKQFLKKRSLNEIHIIGSYGKLLLPCGGHPGYAIGTKITNLVEDHSVIISIMLQFHRMSSF